MRHLRRHLDHGRGPAQFTTLAWLLTGVLACSTPINPAPENDTHTSRGDVDAPQNAADDAELASGSTDDNNVSAEQGPGECTRDSDCEATDIPQCQVAVCDLSSATCVVSNAAQGAPCDDADPCTVETQCDQGVCSAGTPAPPACAELECGDDGCGNVCGACDPGVTCESGACIPPEAPESPFSCDTVSFEGCCTGDGTLVWCEDNAIQQVACSATPSCGWSDEDAYYNCNVDAEVPEPSGALPYLCPGETCATSCEARECGFACGESCGICADGSQCQEGSCVTCSCDGLECGENACGETCGTCAEGSVCSANLVCEPCTCEGLSCGLNACGESCGSCGEGLACLDGSCVDDPCEGVSFEGCCDGETLQYCEDNSLKTLDCSSSPSCGWNAQSGYYDCGGDGAAEPTGAAPILCPNVCYPTCAESNACGDDGCGGSCGECGDGQACGDQGACVDADPCDVLECGPGVCDASSGTATCQCPAGFEGAQCETNTDECAEAPCQNGGTCIDGDAAFTCQCEGTLHTGPTCEQAIFSCDPAWAGCTPEDFALNDHTSESAPVLINTQGESAPYAPTCVSVSVGQSVTIEASSTHPFESVCGEDEALDASNNATEPVTITLTAPGYYNFKCKNHPAMLGNIQVLP